MPELPEVETIKNTLKPILLGNTITKIEVLRPSIIDGNVLDFVENIDNEKFLNITRYGKYLFFHLSNNKVIISHLRMEGKYFEYLESEANSKYARVVFYLSNGHKICYDDSRCFGRLKLSNEVFYKKEKEIAKLGPEPFEADYCKIYDAQKNSKEAIKKTLLNQTVMCGIGNIYCDEILYACKISPNTETRLINKAKWKQIIIKARQILLKAIKEGGSTIKSYHPGKDISGNFQSQLKAYGRNKKPCLTCGHQMRFIKVGSRGTTFCPICQKKMGTKITIAITGKVAAGKSEVLKIFKHHNIPTISADEIVHDLYKDKKIINDINKMFCFPKSEEINLDLLRTHLKINPGHIKQLNKYIHPLVIQKINTFVNNINSGLVAVEIPLLYETHMDQNFDVVIALDISKDQQLKRLKARKKSNSIDLLKINKSQIFDDNKKTATYLVSNNKTLTILEKQINKIICIEKSHLG